MENQNTNLIARNSQHLKKARPLDRHLFDVQIARLEAGKNTDFSAETISVWYDEMIKRGWTDEQFLEKVSIVFEQKQFGGVKFDDFVNAKKTYTEEELQQKIYEAISDIRKRIVEAKTKPINEKLIYSELLENEYHIYAERLDNVRDRLGISLEQRIKKVERFIKRSSFSIKKELLSILEAKKLLKDDDIHWDKIIYLFAPYLLNEVETMMKENK